MKSGTECNADGIDKVCSNAIEKQKAIVARKKRFITKSINNTELRAKPKGLCIFMGLQNIWDFALGKKKKTNPKDFIRLITYTSISASIVFIAR